MESSVLNNVQFVCSADKQISFATIFFHKLNSHVDRIISIRSSVVKKFNCQLSMVTSRFCCPMFKEKKNQHQLYFVVSPL